MVPLNTPTRSKGVAFPSKYGSENSLQGVMRMQNRSDKRVRVSWTSIISRGEGNNKWTHVQRMTTTAASVPPKL